MGVDWKRFADLLGMAQYGDDVRAVHERKKKEADVLERLGLLKREDARQEAELGLKRESHGLQMKVSQASLDKANYELESAKEEAADIRARFEAGEISAATANGQIAVLREKAAKSNEVLRKAQTQSAYASAQASNARTEAIGDVRKRQAQEADYAEEDAPYSEWEKRKKDYLAYKMKVEQQILEGKVDAASASNLRRQVEAFNPGDEPKGVRKPGQARLRKRPGSAEYQDFIDSAFPPSADEAPGRVGSYSDAASRMFSQPLSGNRVSGPGSFATPTEGEQSANAANPYAVVLDEEDEDF